MREEDLPFGERAVSWHTVWDRLYPDFLDPHDDGSAAEMHALRGLVIAQCAEVGLEVEKFWDNRK